MDESGVLSVMAWFRKLSDAEMFGVLTRADLCHGSWPGAGVLQHKEA
jgi:hypothetical protein